MYNYLLKNKCSAWFRYLSFASDNRRIFKTIIRTAFVNHGSRFQRPDLAPVPERKPSIKKPVAEKEETKKTIKEVRKESVAKPEEKVRLKYFNLIFVAQSLRYPI